MGKYSSMGAFCVMLFSCLLVCLFAYFVLLHKVHKGCPLDLHRLALSVVQRQHEVEEVGLPEVGGRLLLVVRPGQAHTAAGTQGRTAARLRTDHHHDHHGHDTGGGDEG